MIDAFWNGFWIFVGVVAGALIQYLLGEITQWRQRANARRLFGVEISINRAELAKLRATLQRKKERFVAGQNTDGDFFMDMSGFNYRIVDPLLNTGHFHDLLGPEGVARYFRYANELNVQNAQNLMGMLRTESEQGRSLAMLDWLLDIKVPEWDSHLGFVEDKIGVAPETKRLIEQK